MIKKIEKCENLGVFDGFKWSSDSEITEFKRWNLIYGTNGSGKTTLSRLFSSLPRGLSPDFPDLKYKIKSSLGDQKQGITSALPIRVFNTDYIRSNIGELEGEINPIFIVGEDKKQLVTLIDKQEQELESRTEAITPLVDQKDKTTKIRGKEFTNVASNISLAAKGLTSRTYRKPQAEAAYAKIDTYTTLNEEQLKVHTLTAEQKELDLISKVSVKHVCIGDDTLELSEALRVTAEQITKQTATTVDNVVIQDFVDSPDVGKWVESGLTLHKESNTCKFCNGNLSRDRLKALLFHFSTADQEFKEDLESTLSDLETLRESLKDISLPSKLEFYDEFQKVISEIEPLISSQIETIYGQLDEADATMQTKISNRSESIKYKAVFDYSNLVTQISKFNEYVASHNKKSQDFEAEKEKAFKAIEEHYLSGIKGEVDKHDEEISNTQQQIHVLENGDPETDQVHIADLKKEIKTNRALVANTQQAALDLTQKLEVFLGRQELKFEPEGDGYQVFRNQQPAKGLSEGEKTAIAFVYFSVQLNDQDFKKENGIVVIDDPISSLDANSRFQAFSFLKESVKDCKQVFISTHCFDFLKLLLGWLKHAPGGKNERVFSMLNRKYVSGQRRSTINTLDPTLTNHSSEYSYLFKLVHNYQCDGTIENAYPMANIMRKLLEHFLDFICPNSDRYYDKFQSLEFDPIKKTALNKYAQDLSHYTSGTIDPSLVPETENNGKYLVELIGHIAPVHYANLLRGIQP